MSGAGQGRWRWLYFSLRALPPLLLAALIAGLLFGGDGDGDSDGEPGPRPRGLFLPVSPPPVSPPSHEGCSILGAGVAPVTDDWRLSAPSGQSALFFAPQAGTPPASGRPILGGVRLPPGSRCPRHWASDRPVRGAIDLASRLAEAFPKTGLWPVLWDFPDSPDPYLSGSGDPSAARHVEPAALIRRLWERFRPRDDFPGLARPSEHSERGVLADPFGTLARSGWGERAAYLILVPAHRPSDVMSVVGFGGTEVLREQELAAVLLSWERRFRAVPTAIGPGALTLVVAAPPVGRKEGIQLAHEQLLVAPSTAVSAARLGKALRFGAPSVDFHSRHVWPLGWPD